MACGPVVSKRTTAVADAVGAAAAVRETRRPSTRTVVDATETSSVAVAAMCSAAPISTMAPLAGELTSTSGGASATTTTVRSAMVSLFEASRTRASMSDVLPMDVDAGQAYANAPAEPDACGTSTASTKRRTDGA